MIQIEQGWAFGEQINDKYRQHPNLRAYKHLDRKVRALHWLPTNTLTCFDERQDAIKLEEPVREALKAVEKLQFHLEKTETGATRIATKPLQRKKQKVLESSHREGQTLHTDDIASSHRIKQCPIIYRKQWISQV